MQCYIRELHAEARIIKKLGFVSYLIPNSKRRQLLSIITCFTCDFCTVSTYLCNLSTVSTYLCYLTTVRTYICNFSTISTYLCNFSTVSMLWAYTSRPDCITVSTQDKSPAKSGVRHSISISGFLLLTSLTVCAKWAAPPSGKSTCTVNLIVVEYIVELL